MKKAFLIISALFCVISCSGCGTEEETYLCTCEQCTEGHNEIEVYMDEENVMLDLELDIDEMMSVQNSNHVNLGYLSTNGVEKIYYINPNENTIYESDLNGKNAKCIYTYMDTSIKYLQVYQKYLYFYTTEGICRLEIDTGECIVVYPGPCGEYRIYNEALYINTSRGIVKTDLDGVEEKVVFNNSSYPVLWNFADNMLIGVAASNTDTSLFSKGYMLALNIETGKIKQLGKDLSNIVVLSNKVAYFNQLTETLHIWEKEAEYDLGYQMEHSFKAIGNRDMVYFAKTGYSEEDMCDIIEIYCWDGENVELIKGILQTEESAIKGLYIADDYIYLLEQRGSEWIWHYCQISIGMLGDLNEK